MSEVKLDMTKPAPLIEEEDDETLAAIDRGARDAAEGRLTLLEEVEKMLEVDFKILFSDQALDDPGAATTLKSYSPSPTIGAVVRKRRRFRKIYHEDRRLVEI